MPTETQDWRMDALLSEYSAVRSFAIHKSNSAYSAISMYLTAIAAIFGVVCGNHADARLLLAVPILAAAFGLTIQYRFAKQKMASDYIELHLQPLIVEYTGDKRLMYWEGYYRDRKSRHRDSTKFGYFILFPGASIAGLTASVTKLDSATDWVAWIFGLAMLAVLTQKYIKRLLLLCWAKIPTRLRSLMFWKRKP